MISAKHTNLQRADGSLSLLKLNDMLEFKDNLAATWAAEVPDLLTQKKENLLKDSTKVLILLIVQSEGKLEDTGSMHSLESLSKITWDHPSREAF